MQHYFHSGNWPRRKSEPSLNGYFSPPLPQYPGRQRRNTRVPSRAHSDGSAGNNSAATWNYENLPAGIDPIKVNLMVKI